MMQNRFTIENAKEFDGQEVTLRGWVHQKRSSGKKLHFLIMRDGTGLMQCVLFKGEVEEASLEAFESLTQESAVRVTGTLREEKRSPGGYEMGVKRVEVVSIAEEFPISPKEHGVEHLMKHRHLWIRSQKQWATLRIRSKVIELIHRFHHERGFIHFDAPILSSSSCEGTSTLFSTEYFDETAFLTQSGQLYGETGAMAFGKVYVFGPTFRAEKSKTRKHLTEFWMVEPEMAFANLSDAMDLGDEFFSYIVTHAMKECAQELKVVERDISTLEKVKAPFPRISYDQAIEKLSANGLSMQWGEDFGAPHETKLGELFNSPVWVHHFPASVKAFYFKRSSSIDKIEDEQNGKYALGCDLIAPDGFGEIIGGGQREENLQVLNTRFKEHDLPENEYDWYLDLRKFGSVPHSGFGLGVERMVSFVAGSSHLRETIPYPRMLNTLRP